MRPNSNIKAIGICVLAAALFGLLRGIARSQPLPPLALPAPGAAAGTGHAYAPEAGTFFAAGWASGAHWNDWARVPPAPYHGPYWSHWYNVEYNAAGGITTWSQGDFRREVRPWPITR